MDLTTVIGIVVGFALVVASILAGEGSAMFVNIPSLMIVFGGTLGSTLINFSMGDVLSVLKVTSKIFLFKLTSYEQTIENIVKLAERARKEGILSIEKELENIDDAFLKSGVQYAVDGTEPETIRAIMETELSSLKNRHKLGQSIYIAMGTYAPAFGMVGTLIGLIQMLQALEDPSQIGAGMATALVTTFYGALASNLFFLPAAGKLYNRSQEELAQKELVVEGILSIQSGDNPRIVREKLLTYLPPKSRRQMEAVEK